MGCISSKEMIHSASYHRNKMKQRSQRTSKGSNHFLALVCTATSMSDASRSKSLGFESPVSTTETEANEGILTPDQVGDEDDPRIGEHEVCRPDPPKRSRSWHSFPLEEMPDKEDCDVTINTLEVKKKAAIRSRSFHTVKEYDKLLERIGFASFSDNGYTAADPVEKETSTTPTGMNCQAELNNADSQDTLQPLHGYGSLAGESRTNDETVKESFPGEPTPGSKGKDQEEEPVSIETDILSEPYIKEGDHPEEIHPTANGSKRKSIARGLQTLNIPSTFELPAVASLREWLPGGRVFSPGLHPTPKFGSYIASIDTTTKISEESIFNEELVTALEEQLQQLKAEEETILKQITATWEEFAYTEINEDIAIIS